MSQQTDTARLAEINEVLARGVKKFTADGQSGEFELDQLRRERRRLEIKLGLRRKRSRMIRFKIV